ncbi:MAG TPA: hypothetical protein VF070_40665 [Streptosporangiaceae bacterium]
MSEQTDTSAPPPKPRWGLLAGFAAVIVIAALVAGIAAAVRPGSPEPRYAAIPPACALISGAHVAKYLPEAQSQQRNLPSSGTLRNAACDWTSIASGAERTVTVNVGIYGSASGATLAERAFSKTMPVFFCGTCPKGSGFQQTAQPVTGLGNQSMAWLAAMGSGALVVHWVELFVQSGNAYLEVTYNIAPLGPGAPFPGDTVLLADTTAMTRDVLASLARPAQAASPPIPSPGPRYANPAGPCDLVTAATLTRYLPGATRVRADEPTGYPGGLRSGDCGWATPHGASLSTNYRIFAPSAGPLSAQQAYTLDVSSDSRGMTTNDTDSTVDYTPPVPGVGAEATAIFETVTTPALGDSGTSHVALLLAWSGNAEIQVRFTYDDRPLNGAPPPSPPSRAAQLAAAVAVARDMLAALPRA